MISFMNTTLRNHQMNISTRRRVLRTPSLYQRERPKLGFRFGSNLTEESREIITWTTIFTTFVWASGCAQSPCAGIALLAYGSLLCEVFTQSFNTVRQHAILLPGPHFWTRRRPPSWKFQDFQYFNDQKKLDASITFHQMHGSSWDFACTKRYPFPTGVLSLVQIWQRNQEISSIETRFTPHLFRPVGGSYRPARVFLSNHAVACSARYSACDFNSFNTVRQHAILLPRAHFQARRRPQS